MSTFTFTLTSDDPTGPVMMASVRLEGDDPVVTQLTVRPGAAGTALPAALATVDFAELMRMAVPMSQGRLHPGPAGAPRPAQPPDPEVPDAATPGAELVDPPVEPHSAVSPAARRTSSRAAGGGAVPPDLAVVFWRLGSAAKVAAHYAVPRQIAADWIRLLRVQGTAPNPWKRTRPASKGRGR